MNDIYTDTDTTLLSPRDAFVIVIADYSVSTVLYIDSVFIQDKMCIHIANIIIYNITIQHNTIQYNTHVHADNISNGSIYLTN